MTSRLRKHGRLLVVLICVYLAVAAALNTLVNPLRIIPGSWSIAALDDYRDIRRDVRTGKAGLACAHKEMELAVVGSSRFEISMEPLQPALRDKKAVNLAMAAASLRENMAMTRYILARAPHLRQLIFGLDMGDLSSDFDTRKVTGYYSSPLAGGGSSFEGGISNVIGVETTEESVSTLYRFARKIPSSRNRLGRWITPNHPANFRAYLSTYKDVIFAQVPEIWEQQQPVMRADKFEELTALLTDLRRRGVEVLLTIPPQLACKQLHPMQDAPTTAPWRSERRAIEAMCREVNAKDIPGGPAVQLWDFATFSEQTCVALPVGDGRARQLPNWFDTGHFGEEIGRQMVERMLGASQPPAGRPLSEQFGINVLQVGIDAHLEGLRLGHARYCREHPDDVAWVRSLMGKSSDDARR